MPRLSTHVLDTARGAPARGVAIDLYRYDSSGPCTRLKSTFTNTGGRTDEPLLLADELTIGNYELVFHAGDYFRTLGLRLPDPPFLDRIAIRFGISDAHGDYHVPLLLSPYGYSTYRGS
ncbi:MAG: hydroxyisourate hydrolase [Acidobacteriota bacterium]|nr:hydroxyisourate hydrolase [Acidobacteriota bacterium]